MEYNKDKKEAITMKKKNIIIGVIILALIIFFIILSSRCGYVPPEDIFKIRIANPIPANVTILQGRGYYAGRGGHSFIVFTADEEIFNKLSKNYESLLDYSSVPVNIMDYIKKDIRTIPGLKCYQQQQGGMTLYMFWDKSDNKVYFYETN
ncbi:MAG: hypothetical protein AB1668_06720 [Nanoarchaeota archaeon]